MKHYMFVAMISLNVETISTNSYIFVVMTPGDVRKVSQKGYSFIVMNSNGGATNVDEG